MRKTGVAVLCQKCGDEFEVFSDDDVGDFTAIWNWCPHCGFQNQLWMRFLDSPTAPAPAMQVPPTGISHRDARIKFGNIPDTDTHFRGKGLK